MPAHGGIPPSAAARAEARRGLYVHVPFCARRCTYCDFSTGALGRGRVDRYLDAMALEAERRAPAAAGRAFTSVFFGGGTPSALGPREFRRLWSIVTGSFDVAPGAEITLEANPESVRAPLAEAWREAGVDRLSMGAQSFAGDELERLGRIHDARRPAAAAAVARAAGFRRLSFDLMFAFPGQSPASLAASLEAALAIDPEHLSVYCFIPEPGTPLGDAVRSGRLAVPDDAEQAEAHAAIEARLARAGLEAYETSNFCRPGAEARHNLVYWLRRPYLGLGPSAHGFWSGERYGNAWALEDWAERLERGVAPEAEREPESEASAAREIVMLALRLAGGLRAEDHAPAAWAAVRRRYGGSLDRALATGRLERRCGALRVPPALRFVADDVIAWIEADAERAGFDSLARRSITSNACPSLPSRVA